MFGMADAAEIGHAADIPQQGARRARSLARAATSASRQRFAQRIQVVGLARADQRSSSVGRLLQRGDQARRPSRNPEPRHCAIQLFQRREAVVHDRLATSSSSGGASPVTPKVPSDMPRPARPAIWASSFGAKSRIRRPSNLVSPAKRHVVDVEVQPHADGVGGHQIIDIAVLIQLHLRVARARAERAHDHRRAALLRRISSAMA